MHIKELREVLATAHYQTRNRLVELKVNSYATSTIEECEDHLTVIRRALDEINSQVNALDQLSN